MKNSPLSRTPLLVLAAWIFAHAASWSTQAGSLLREVWTDIGGTAVSDLTNDPRYPNSPSETDYVTDFFEAPTDVLENYGQRLHGYILPPVTGNYKFWIASDDGGELWLSTDESPGNVRRIAAVSGWTSSREWTREPGQESASVRLEANRPYYVMALQKEGGGGDNLAVRWLRPDNVDEGPIPATYLLPWGTSFTPPKIVQQPANATVVEGAMAMFTVQSDPLSPSAVQWQKNGTDIAGATGFTLTYGPATLNDNNARFRAVLVNQLGSTISSEGILTVTPDLTRPAIAAVLNLGTTTIRLTFSEPVDSVSGTNPQNYRISGGITVTGATVGSDAQTILLTVSPLTYNSSYTITVNNVQDRAATPNAIQANSTINFVAAEYAPVNIGTGSGTTLTVPGGFEVTGTGSDIGGNSDQFHFGYQERTGDFDYRVRIADLSISNPFVQAGLIVRDSLAGNSRFFGVFSSSAQLGCFVESRTSTGGQSQIAAPRGGFPVNYPSMWLRLRRSGTQFTGYASFDGAAWQELGSASINLPSQVYFGMAVASHDANATSTVQFRDLSAVVDPATFTYVPTREPIGPSNRRTGLTFSEIMYNPATRADGKDLEFIEIYNGESIFVDMSGWRLTGAVDYTFPDGFKLEAGAFAVVAIDPASLQSVYGINGVLGPYSGRLNNAGDILQLRNKAGAIRVEVEYSPISPWPVAADGAGHSLALARPSYGENDSQAWSASERIGGSPGQIDAITANRWASVVINEFLAHTDDPVLDFIELYNASNASVDISGCVLTDNATTNKFRIPNGTILPARGFISFDQNQLGFALDAGGETIYLIASDASRILDAIRFEGQENGISSGRSPDGSPTIRRLANPTPAAANASWRVEDIVINEIMYQPITRDDADQYVELHNRSGSAVNLAGWSFVSGISFSFPAGASIPAGGYAVVAKDAAHLRANYPQLTTANTFGNFSGRLSGSGERLALAKPDEVRSTNSNGTLTTNLIYITVSETTYVDGGQWPELADGGGSSLELTDPRADTLRPSNWAASDETQKAEWTTAEFTGRAEFGTGGVTANRLYITMQGAGECLVDNVEIFRAGSTNLLRNGDFESGSSNWSFFGNHSKATIDSAGAFAGQGVLHLRTPGDGDTANNSIRGSLVSAVTSGQTYTIRARVRWLSGWPEILFRVRGNWIELPARMSIPKNLGTPGQANSRRIPNAGPAIFDVTHTPPLPRASQSVVVTCRVSDPDGAAAPRLRYRADPSTTLTSVTMRDDGAGGDAVAGDGIYSATIPGRSSGTLIAFRIEASDDAASSATTVFPSDAPARECLIRWDDPIPFGTFAHYHMWNVAAVDQARGASRPLDNTYRDCTLIYNNYRVIYNAAFRDKGSPYHGGSGDYALTVPRDNLLLGVDDRVFARTGNGGGEQTGMRGDVAGWIGEQMGIPFLHSHFMRLYRNGGQFDNVSYDLEQPNRYFAESWFGESTGNDTLYKIAVWFEFQDDNSSFQSTGATLENFISGGAYKLARYRWNWQPRPEGTTVNDYTSIFNLAAAANSSTERVTGLMNLADMEEWMRVFAYNRVLGNWDSWTFNVGQNMYIYTPQGHNAVLLPWDIDFVLGLGNGPTDSLWGGQDGTMNQVYNVPAYRRMLWRAYQDAVAGPMQPAQYNPQIDARRAALLKNGVTGISDTGPIKSYINSRRTHLENQIRSSDNSTFAITSNNGNDFTSTGSVATLTGTAPFAVATIEVNGIPYPVSWTGFNTWRIEVPLGAATNSLQIVGRDLRGQAVPEAADSIVVRYTGAIPQPQDWVVINEIMYNPGSPDAEFVELYNRHPTASFDLSNLEFSGLSITLPSGTVIAPNGYLVLAENRAGFATAYGANIPVAAVYSGKLDNSGEMLRLLRRGASAELDVLIDDVRYDRKAPWPTEADGLGWSLQLIDPAQDNWRVGNWTIAPAGNPNLATPGRANATRTTIDPFPGLWINEVLSQNQAGATDNAGEREPWIELYNAENAPLDLSGYFLSDDYTDLRKWSFPAGTTLGAKQFLLIWADGETSESAPNALHANFRLRSTGGAIALSRLQFGEPAVMDFIEYPPLSTDRAFGSVPDGNPRVRRSLLVPSPGAPNNSSSPTIPVVINEWMASNQSTIQDPADGKFEDWLELYNAGTTSVDLSGFYLSRSLTDVTEFRIPDGTVIPAGGFKLFWADNETNQNGPGRDVHTNFKLPAEGGHILLLTPTGETVDHITFESQITDISSGRFPDGGEPPFLAFLVATPGTPNRSESANQAPALAVIPDQTVVEEQQLVIQATASDPDVPAQTLTFSLLDGPAGAIIDPSTGRFSWTPAEDQGPGAYLFSIRVTDNGTPARSATRSVTVTVAESNRAPVLAEIPNQTIDEGSPFEFSVIGSDADLPPQKLTYSLGANAPAGAVIDPATGDFSWTPSEEHGPGAYTVTVRVSDEGSPALEATRSFVLTVREINNPPLVTPISPLSIDENTNLRVQIEARDTDNPPVALSYALIAAPPGATIDPVSGLVTWTPAEADGPRDYNFTVRVSEPGGTPNATMSFLVGVREVNTAPTLEPIANITARPGDSINLTLRAADADLPPQTLIYSVVTALPEGANLDSATGILTWTVPDDPTIGTNRITIRVSDDVTPALTAEQSFQIVVVAPLRIAINEIQHRPATVNAEFVEIANHSAANSVDISGWRLEGYNFIFPAGTVLQPRGFLCVAKNTTAFGSAYGSAPRVLGNANVTLPAEGGLVRLLKPASGGSPEEVIDQVQFSTLPPWPAAAGQGASLQLIDARQDHWRVANWASSTGSITNAPISITSMTGSWKYWQNSAAPAAAWNTVGFNDGAWPSGNALLYVEDAALPAAKNTRLTLGPATFYFRTKFEFNGNPTGASLRMNLILDDGAIVYLNGNEIFRIGMPEGPVTPSTFANRTVGDAVLEGPFDVPATGLRTGENIIAVEVHQINAGSSDLAFGASVDLITVGAASHTPGAPNSVTRDLPAFPLVWINEVVPNNTSGATDNAGDRDPWIELYNGGDQPLNLESWSLTDDFNALGKSVFSAGVSIPARGYLIVWADGETAESTSAAPHTNFRPGSPSGSIALARLQGGQRVVVDYVNYAGVSANQSFGSATDGAPFERLVLANPTPGTSNQSAPAPRPTMQIALTASGEVSMVWNTKPGTRYRVQVKSALEAAEWTTVSDAVATSNTQTFTEVVPNNTAHRFYRIVAE